MHTHVQERYSEHRLPLALGWFSLALGTAEIAAPRTMARLIGVADDPRLMSVMHAFGAREIAAGLGLLTQPHRSGWAWARVSGDAIDLAFLGSAAGDGNTSRQRAALAAAAVVGVTALDLICARDLREDAELHRPRGSASHHEVSVDRAITVNRPIDEVYRFWKDYANLPRFMAHLVSVETLAQHRTRWTARGPAGFTVSWDAETLADRENEWIAWRSLENADVDNRGSVRFQRAPGDRGTEVLVHLEYQPPAGRVGRGIAWIFGEEPGQQVKEDLRRFKQLMETGEIPLAEGHGIRRPAQPVEHAGDVARAARVDPHLAGTSARLEGGLA